jgi:hypothetical protein
MNLERLNYLATASLDRLVSDIPANLYRYREGDFTDMVDAGGWSIELNYGADLSALQELDSSSSPQAEIENSIRVWRCFHDMTPALACENRVWARFSHVECLDYSRERWLISDDDTKAVEQIKKHFFAPTLNSCRDDHAISRLWWNAKIAKILRPENQRSALELFLAKADIRKSVVERSVLFSRPVIGRAILRVMERDDWATAREANFRELMNAVNFLGGGIVFELYSDNKMDHFLDFCRNRAEEVINQKAA